MKTHLFRVLDILLSVLLLPLVFSCSPTYDYISFEKNISKGCFIEDINSKRFSVIIASGSKTGDSLLLATVSSGITKYIEQEVSQQESKTPVYNINPNDVNLSSTTSLLGYTTLLNSDILLIVSDLLLKDFEFISNDETVVQNAKIYKQEFVILPYSVNYKVYSAVTNQILYSKNVKDTIVWGMLSEKGINSVKAIASANKGLALSLETLGYQWADSIFPKWKIDNRRIYSYDSKIWDEAFLLAANFQWEEALKIWTKLAKSENQLKASAAAYNAAVALEVLGDFQLSSQWLDYSIRLYDELPGQAELKRKP